MRSRRGSPEHQAAVSRRLAQLSAELAATRGEAAPQVEMAPAAGGEWWSEHTRVAQRPAPPLALVPEAEPAQPVLAPPEVPSPGRHAARRSRQVLASVFPETLRGRAMLGPAQLAVVAIMVALGLAVTAWWVVRGDADQEVSAGVVRSQPAGELVALPSAAPASATPSAPPGATEASGGAATVTVDVAGKVRRPGIAVLDSGARVVDALEAAGGARPGADLSSVNLARLLVDGEQILVGLPTTPADPAIPAAPAPGTPAGPLVDLNLADQPELETLPEVGPVTAAAIISWREEHGGFTAVDELLEVDGIGDVTLGQIAPHVTV